MINKRDLRIGNLFHPIQTNTPVHLPTTFVFEVKTIELTGVRSMSFGKNESKIDFYPEFKYNELSGILLTEEWLIKLGFENGVRKGDYFIYIGDRQVSEWIWSHEKPAYLGISILDRIIWLQTDDKVYTEFSIKDGYCVHEFQNLAYAIVGKELVYKQSVECSHNWVKKPGFKDMYECTKCLVVDIQ